MPAKLPNQIGKKYGRWTVQEYGKEVGYTKYVICVCDCGNIAEIQIKSLRNGRSTSCGCYKREAQGLRAMTHGLSGHDLYHTYKNIRSRCNDKKSLYYGERGIKCEWQSFDDFYRDMHEGYKKGLQIDRIDSNGNYCKDNCRWVTPRENVQNRRNTVITAEIAKKCEEHGIKYDSIYYYMKRYGMSAEEVINKKTR